MDADNAITIVRGNEFSDRAMYVVNHDEPHIMSAMEKIAEHAKPGAIIPLSKEEFQAITSGNVAILKGAE